MTGSVFFLFAIVNLVIQSVNSHPQCLDSHAPFRPKGNIRLCKSYSYLGCCTEKDDAKLKILYEEALRKSQNPNQCQSYLSEMVCLRCHSWSAHIFNAESNPNFKPKLALPCLGAKYCKHLMRKCKTAVEHIWRDALQARNVTVHNFCQQFKAALNKDYCYPKITTTLKRLSSSKLNTAKGSLASKKGCLCVRKIAQDLRNPLALVHANDQTHRMFIVEQVGVVHILLHNGNKLKIPFLNITEKVFTSRVFGDERGLLGIAFHPLYRKNGRLFIYYNAKTAQGLIMLSEFRVSTSDPNQVDPKSEKTLLTIQQPAENHNGGQLLFGDDKYLYVFPGDGGKAGDPFGLHGNGLNKSTLLGKVLRIDIDNTDGKAYKIPADNPFLNESKSRPEIFAYGVRNMWRCSVDRGNRSTGYGKGRMFCGDVGQDKYEEIDIIVKGGNYGWRGREGYKCYDKKLCNSSLLANDILPIHVYNHKVGQSIVGGYVYRGCNYPRLRGLYFFADTMNGRMFTLKENRKTGEWRDREVCMGDKMYCTGPNVSGSYAKMILSFGESEAGELYILSTQYARTLTRKGAVYQLIDPTRRADPLECKYAIKKPAKFTCKDRLTLMVCNYYKDLNFCIKYHHYMNIHCKQSCNKC